MTTTIQDPTIAAPAVHGRRFSPKLLFYVGTIFSLLLIPLFFAQVFWAGIMITPWYVPIGGTVAALVVLYSLVCQFTWWRLPVALVCMAIACLEWQFLLAGSVLPAYKGPFGAGSPVPAFHANLADGTEIDASYFALGKPTALVFFQGRWCPFCMTHLRELEAHHDELTRVGANLVVVSIENVETAAATQRQFPHLTVISDHRRELSNAVDVINAGFHPEGGDSAAPTILLIDGQGQVLWLHRPVRFIARPSAAEIAATLKEKVKGL